MRCRPGRTGRPADARALLAEGPEETHRGHSRRAPRARRRSRRGARRRAHCHAKDSRAAPSTTLGCRHRACDARCGNRLDHAAAGFTWRKPPGHGADYRAEALRLAGHSIAISPDGSRVAYLGADGALLVRALDESRSTLLVRPDNAQPVDSPFFSHQTDNGSAISMETGRCAECRFLGGRVPT